MSNPADIKQLYFNVLCNDIRSHSVTKRDIKAAIYNMSIVYKPDPQSLSRATRQLANYNTVAHRCAYLHKYAPFHTAMVSDLLRKILYQHQDLFWTFQQLSTKSKFKICSLGGGPGSDIVGVVAALTDMFSVFPWSAKVVDIKSDWENTLWSVIQEMRSGDYGIVGQCFKSTNFDWEYLTADLLGVVEGDVEAAIGNADLVTMVKFVSAAACRSTETMLTKIFMMLKAGSMVLFIDNSGGGFRQLVSKAARNCNLIHVCPPINSENYTNEYFNVSLFDYPSCFSSTVSIHMLQKLNENGNEAKNTFPNKRIKSAVFESSNHLQVQNLNVPKLPVRQEPKICSQGSDGKVNPVRAECLVEKKIHLGIQNGSNFGIQNGPLSMHSKRSSSAMADSALAVKDVNRKPYNYYNNPNVDVNFIPKALNEDPSVSSYDAVVNSPPKGMQDKIISFSNDLSNHRSIEHSNAEIATFPVTRGAHSEVDKENYLKKNKPICKTSTKSLQNDSFNTPIDEETSANLCCSSCVIS